jgi:uncharacterized protein YqjF (DUF2071 family)
MIVYPSLEVRQELCLPPQQSVVMHQQWRNLAFLHWKMEPEVVQRTLPEGLFVDTFEGAAWVALVPFEMRGIRPRFCPPVPGVSDFLELNVRTYVHDARGRPGAWFYSLDCNQALAVWVARTVFHLPYHKAVMGTGVDADGWVEYNACRRGDGVLSGFRYRFGREQRQAEAGGLDFFLVERYLLFSQTPRGLRTGRVHHRPYPVVDLELGAWDERLLGLAGLPLPGRMPDHVCGSPSVEVKVFPLMG